MSLVSRYGTPTSRTADALEATIEAAVQFLANKNRDDREIAMREREFDFTRTTAILSSIQKAHPDMVIPVEAWDDDAILAEVQQEAHHLTNVKSSALQITPSTDASLSDFAEDAVFIGGLEIVGPDGSVQVLDMDQSPFGMEARDVAVVEQWLNGNSYLEGLVFRDTITIEEIAELERMGLFEPGKVTVDNWGAADNDQGFKTTGDQLREDWALYSKYITQNEDFMNTTEYAQAENLAIVADSTIKSKIRDQDIEYKLSEQTVLNYQSTFTASTTNADADAILVGGKEFDSWNEVAEEGMTKLATVSSMPIDKLNHYWDNQKAALLKEAKANNYVGLYHQMEAAVKGYRYIKQIDAEYDFGNLASRREGELAEGTLDRIRDVQIQLDPLFGDLEGRVLGNEISYNDAVKELRSHLGPIMRQYGFTGETRYDEEKGKWVPVKDPIMGEQNPTTNNSLLDDIFDAYFEKLAQAANSGGQ